MDGNILTHHVLRDKCVAKLQMTVVREYYCSPPLKKIFLPTFSLRSKAGKNVFVMASSNIL